MATKPNFDPVAMGLDKQWTGRNMDITDAHDYKEEGTQTGWSKSLGGGKTQQYDMDGNDKGITDDKDQMDYVKTLAAGAALATGIGALGGFGPLGGLLGNAGAAVGAAANGGFTAAEIAMNAGASAMTTGEALMPSLAAFTDAEIAMNAGASAMETLAPTLETVASTAAPAALDSAAGFESGFSGTSALTDAAASGVTSGMTPEVISMVAANPGAASMIKSAFGDVSSWIKANPELSKIIFSTVGGAVAAVTAGNMANAANQNKLDQINLVQQNKLDDNKRFSESVSGLRKPGLIAQGPLKRNDGSRVYSGNGLINRSAA